MLKNWKLWLGFVISTAGLYLTLRDIRFDEFFTQLAKAEAIWFLPAVAALSATLTMRAWRWSALMNNTPFGVTFHAMLIGYLINSTLPLRLGELARAWVIGQNTTVSMARALSSVVVERALDLATVVLMFAVFAQYIPMPAAFSHVALSGGIFIFGLVMAVGLMIWQAERAEQLLSAILGRLERRAPRLNAARLIRLFKDVCGGFRVINTPRKALWVLLTNIGVWATNMLVAYFTMWAFMPGQLEQAGLVMVMANLGGALPSAPGGLGVVQPLARESLVIPFGADKNAAVAFAFVWSLGQQLILIALGLISLTRLGLSFGKVTAGSQIATYPAQQADQHGNLMGETAGIRD
ncbi:MAG: lysylphosphatidylglycerol synthase transmembrane domain-containing protein [Anaerolineae bacterium]|nr:flippase-like domain-containing protein [Thermoflexales bacterium]MDW8408399.1 lysylphosphatidylglycerol synthase transmembrane domain-containing protein [Anaerolineae bacterium]